MESTSEIEEVKNHEEQQKHKELIEDGKRMHDVFCKVLKTESIWRILHRKENERRRW